MKVLFYIYSLHNGGAERVTASLSNYWSTLGWQITIVTLATERVDFYELQPTVRRISLDLAIESGNLLVGLWNNIRRIWRLRRLLKQVKPDVAVAMMTTANVLFAFAGIGMSNISVIGSERTYPSRLPARSLWGFLRRWTYGRLSAVVAQTQDAATWLRMNTAARCVVVIPNPTEWPLPVQAPILAPETIIAPKTHVLLSVGRLDGVKGFDCLIDVFTALAAKHPNWNLVILGDGPQRKTLEAQASKHGMETRIFLPGIVGNVAQWYSHTDLYVLSSRFEGFPNSLVEALAHGLPAVSFDCDSGPREIIRHGVDGLLVPAGDVPALRSALDKVMADQSMRYGFAERATEARERFSIRRIAGMWEDLFLRLQ